MRIIVCVVLALAGDARAETGWSPQGLPLISYSSDEGLGYGLRLLLIDHGQGVEQPYRYAITAQFFQTTKAVASHFLSLDAPRFLATRARLGVDLGMVSNRFYPYYGLGNDSTYQPSFDTCGERASLGLDPEHCSGNPDFKGLRYYRYQQRTLPRFKLNLRYDLIGPWKIFAGYRFRLTRITPLYGLDDYGQRDVSQLINDAQAGRITSWDGSDPSRSFSSPRRAGDLRSGVRRARQRACPDRRNVPRGLAARRPSGAGRRIQLLGRQCHAALLSLAHLEVGASRRSTQGECGASLARATRAAHGWAAPWACASPGTATSSFDSTMASALPSLMPMATSI